ncbi:peptidoglycan DD-metalloendopeptidase family protein [Nocardia neocaledoniensis]|uniref:Transglycosylase-like protein with SLT domain n=1 Tax=Nocardia neocaledoniensis TaxID=236511 RepID=A0A317NGL7_9NOCA|nr:peptidoglycan DD-metalloendopeptidase family protein [Nocardia neocaledoniensis]PWV74461.1 transglycosylase-like protein with SLT domain [Nocardia neocaledoniensis]
MSGAARATTAVIGAVLLLVVLLLFAGSAQEWGCAPSTAKQAPSSGTARTMPMTEGTYTLTSGFGMRWGTQHQGQDFAAAPKTPIYAVADGVVVRVGEASGFGIWVVIDHNIDGEIVSSVYGHMFADDVEVEQGQTVRIGQLIAGVGYNGQTVPAGPDGAHLHLEIWTGGGRFGGGAAIDPMPWLRSGSVDPTSPAGSTDPAPSTTPGPSGSAVIEAATQAGSELPAMPASIGSERGLQVDTIRLARTIVQQFPQVREIGGQREDPLPDHPSGRAIDILIPDPTSGEGKALGDRIADFVITNAAALRIDYLIWRQTYRSATGESNLMEDRGSVTANHFDHVHVTTLGGGYPDDGAPIGPVTTDSTGVASATVCGPALGDTDLDPGTVPEELVAWYQLGGTVCPQITSPLLAAQGKQESGFRRGLTSPAGAQGLAQFLPGTATALATDGQPYVIDADGNGVASVWDDGDAIIGQARYMCDIADKVDTWISEGKVVAPHGPAELYLAGYNAGEHAVLQSGGFPTGSPDYEIQTRPYVANILATATQMTTTLS